MKIVIWACLLLTMVAVAVGLWNGTAYYTFFLPLPLTWQAKEEQQLGLRGLQMALAIMITAAALTITLCGLRAPVMRLVVIGADACGLAILLLLLWDYFRPTARPSR